jgi:site-specific DNA-methyltransferase (adenine-specific)
MDLLRSDKYAINKKNKADGLDLLANINDNTVATAFFDPQYRGVLDKLKYGNEGQSRGKARCDLQQMDEDTIIKFIKEIDRVLKDSGHLFLWVDKFHLCQGTLEWFTDTDLNLVDMIVWDKGKIGMGYRTRRKSEYLIILQKSPVRAKGCWNDHTIPDVWEEKTVKLHPHSKPLELQKALIEATTEEGDWVIDPASGGYSVLTACQELNRNFIGCDIEFGEEPQHEGKVA